MDKVQTIGNLFGYTRVKGYEGLEGITQVADGNTLLGVEIELEKTAYKTLPKTWKCVEDHSLKLNGMEFVTIPIKFKYLELELQRLYEGLYESHTSVRCSVHVHLNVRDLTLEQLIKLLILYCIFEKSFFNFSGNRWKSNYTTPLYTTPDIVKNFIKHPFNIWYKYSALNLSPIWGGESKKYGTIEFRHLEGSKDITRILNWCNLIVSLKLAAKKFSLEELDHLLKTLNTTSAYYTLAHNVFGQWSELLLNQPTFKEDIESCITRTKFMFYEDPTIKEETKIKKPPFFKPYAQTVAAAEAGPAYTTPTGTGQYEALVQNAINTILQGNTF